MLQLLLCLCRLFEIGGAKADGEDVYVCDNLLTNQLVQREVSGWWIGLLLWKLIHDEFMYSLKIT